MTNNAYGTQWGHPGDGVSKARDSKVPQAVRDATRGASLWVSQPSPLTSVGGRHVGERRAFALGTSRQRRGMSLWWLQSPDSAFASDRSRRTTRPNTLQPTSKRGQRLVRWPLLDHTRCLHHQAAAQSLVWRREASSGHDQAMCPPQMTKLHQSKQQPRGLRGVAGRSASTACLTLNLFLESSSCCARAGRHRRHWNGTTGVLGTSGKPEAVQPMVAETSTEHASMMRRAWDGADADDDGQHGDGKGGGGQVGGWALLACARGGWEQILWRARRTPTSPLARAPLLQHCRLLPSMSLAALLREHRPFLVALIAVALFWLLLKPRHKPPGSERTNQQEAQRQPVAARARAKARR